MAEIKKCKCLLCGNCVKNEILACKASILLSDNPEFFEYLYCSVCGSLIIHQFPVNLDYYYDFYKDLYPSLKQTSHKQFRIILYLKKYIISHANALAKIFASFLSSFHGQAITAMLGLKIPTCAKILDVGCGAGHFLCTLFDLGYKDVFGVDRYFSGDIKNYIKKNIHEDFYSIQESYDYIFFNHSLEHMWDLHKIANHCYKIANKFGQLIIRIPNIDSQVFSALREKWTPIHAPYHLMLPSQSIMKDIFHKAGFKLIRIKEEEYHISFYRRWKFLIKKKACSEVISPHVVFYFVRAI